MASAARASGSRRDQWLRVGNPSLSAARPFRARGRLSSRQPGAPPRRGPLDCGTVPHPLLSRVRDAARQNLRPGLVLWSAALAVLALYYGSPGGREALENWMQLKVRYGAGYSFVAGAVFAGLLPRLVMTATGVHRGPLAPELAFGALFWGYKAVEVDFFYRLQSHLFGDGTDWRTLLAKTFVDQALYSAMWAVPTITIVYACKEAGWRWPAIRQRLDRRFFRLELPSVMIGNAMVWTPTVMMVYLLPPALQLPVSNFVAAFWVLVLVLLVSRRPVVEATA